MIKTESNENGKIQFITLEQIRNDIAVTLVRNQEHSVHGHPFIPDRASESLSVSKINWRKGAVRFTAEKEQLRAAWALGWSMHLRLHAASSMKPGDLHQQLSLMHGASHLADSIAYVD